MKLTTFTSKASSLALILLISVTFSQSDALAQSPETDSITKQNKKKRAQTSKSSKSDKKKKINLDRAQPFDGYDWELSTALRYNSSTGTVKQSADAEDTNLVETNIGAGFSVGYMASDHVEPIMEVEYITTTRTISDYTSNGSILSLDIGFLINLPQIDRSVQISNYTSKLPVSEMNLASWIPYFGFFVGTTTASDAAGDTTKLTLEGTDLNTKFVLGCRYMMYPNIGFNFSLRALYEKSSSEVTTSAKKGASRSKIKLDIRLLSLTLMI